MQIALCPIYKGKKYFISLFAYWGDLTPYKWLKKETTLEYKIGDKTYYHYKSSNLCIITRGKKYIISITIKNNLPKELKKFVQNIVNEMTAN